jgi:hypothetical protein
MAAERQLTEVEGIAGRGLVMTIGGYAGVIAIRGDEYFGSKADLMTTITAKAISDALSRSHTA